MKQSETMEGPGSYQIKHLVVLASKLFNTCVKV